MDSGNSGSMQSSSGGDEEYDSSHFLNNNPNSAHFGSISSNPQQFLSHQQPTFFDPHSQNLDTSFSNNDLIWTRGLRSDLNNFNNNFGGGTSSASSNAAQVHPLHQHQNPFPGSASLPLQQQSSVEASAAAAANVGRAGSNTAQPDHPQPNVAKNPKKRTRASRRAPTTVLTTDTTNFRQMVQEFTGIPTAPFTGSPYSRRLDLFSTAGSAMRSSHLDSLGPLYPLRPSAQKVQVSPFMPQITSNSSSSSLLSSSMIDALMPTNNSGNNSMVGTATANASTSTPTPASTSFQLGNSDHHQLGIQKQGGQNNNNLFSMQNQILSFQPLGNNEQLGISTNNLSGFQGGVSSQARNDHGNISRLWRGSSGGNNDDGGHQENQMMRSFDANNNNSSQNVISGYKLNCSATNSTSEFHPEKGLENVCSSTGDHQGPVSSWTCPSE